MKKTVAKISVLSLLLFGILASCKKFEDVNKIAKTAWNPNLAVPIGYKTFGVYDILASQDSLDLVVIDPNTGALALNYFSQLAAFDASSVVGLTDFSQNYSLSLADLNVPSSPSFNGTINSSKNQTLTITTQNGEKLNTVFFKSGTFNLHLETTLQHNLNVTLTFPDLKLNNVPISKNVLFTYTAGDPVPQIQDVQIDLAEVQADFTLGGTSFNQTNINIQTQVVGSGQPVSGTEDFSMNIASSNLSFHNITGDVGQQTLINLSDSVLLKIFKNSTDGTFQLVNPTIDFDIDNSFGIPININLGTLQTINTSTGQITPLSISPGSQTINVNAPTVIGQNALTNFELNSSNTTNISTIISPTPKYFSYELDAQTNPSGVPPSPNFVDENSHCILTANVNMPLEGFAYGFHVTDTIDFTGFENQDVNLIEYVMFRIIVDNGFPVQLGTQITALDANNLPLFSIFNQPENIIEPAPVDGIGRVTSSVRKISDIVLTSAQIAQLANTKKIIVYGEASTTDSDVNKVVKFYDDYLIKIKLALQIQAQTQF